jgi:hypothetical protein
MKFVVLVRLGLIDRRAEQHIELNRPPVIFWRGLGKLMQSFTRRGTACLSVRQALQI